MALSRFIGEGRGFWTILCLMAVMVNNEENWPELEPNCDRSQNPKNGG